MDKKADRRVEVMIAGVGGRGVLVVGELLVVGGQREYKHGLWFPIYATGVRGAPCQCTVILSDNDIHSPTVSQADVVMIMDPGRLIPFRNRVKPGGIAIIEEGSPELDRDDVPSLYIPSMKIAANEIGDNRTANMIFLGVLITKTGIISAESIEAELKQRYKGKEKVLALNMAALHKGMEIGAKGLC